MHKHLDARKATPAVFSSCIRGFQCAEFAGYQRRHTGRGCKCLKFGIVARLSPVFATNRGGGMRARSRAKEAVKSDI
jgi:hypothetical protein